MILLPSESMKILEAKCQEDTDLSDRMEISTEWSPRPLASVLFESGTDSTSEDLRMSLKFLTPSEPSEDNLQSLTLGKKWKDYSNFK